MTQSRVAKIVSLALLIASLLVAFAGFAYPVYVIRPFRHQGARELAAALAVIQVRPRVELVCALCALAGLLAFLVLETRRRRRIWAITGAFLACTFAVLTRVNIYELMFHPAGQPVFVAPQQVKLDADEMVIAVKVNGSARAYPIRSISYHHIVNDVVGREPIVATY